MRRNYCLSLASAALFGVPMFAAESQPRKVDVCHIRPNGTANIINVSVNALDAMIAQGDYPAQLLVDHSFTEIDAIHFSRISDAVAAVDSTRRAHKEKTAGACRITIQVAAGDYTGSFTNSSSSLERFPLLILVPDVSLVGDFKMRLDADGRATGTSDAGISSLIPDAGPAGVFDALVVVAADDAGYHGDRVSVQGFRFTSGFDASGTTSGRIGVGAIGVKGLKVSSNKFEATLNSAVDLRASNAAVVRNHGRKLAVCGLCLAGPGSYEVSDNRLLDGGFTAVLSVPVIVKAIFSMALYPSVHLIVPAPPTTSTITTTVVNNDLSEYVRQSMNFGSGVRIVTFAVDAPNATQQSTVTLRKNRLYHNSFAVDVDANSGLAALAGHAELGLTLKENAIGPSCRNNLFVSFTRISRTLNGVAQVYLNNSTFTLTLNGNTPWSNAWYDNSLGTNNHLFVDTVAIPTGKRISPSDNPAGC